MTTATNTILTIDQITARALVVLHQKLNFVGSINRQYDDSFSQSGAKIGDTIRIRNPVQYLPRQSIALTNQNTVQTNTSLSVSNISGVDMNFTTRELMFNLNDFSRDIIEPAIAVVAADIESRALAMFKDVYNEVSGQGSPQSFKNFLIGRKKLLDGLTPQSRQWRARINTQDNVDMVDSLKGLFQSSQKISEQYTDGLMGYTAGFEFAENTHLSTFLRGAESATYVLNGVPASGATTAVVATGTGAGLKGDVFTVAGVFRVHPETKASTNVLQQFVLTVDYAGGAGTISFSPAMTYTSGAYQNVGAAPATNAPITFTGTLSTASGVSLVYHPDAFTLATVDGLLPNGVDMAARAVKDGISMTIVRQYQISDTSLPCRVDVYWGCKTIRPQLACRVAAN
jgi:hypothetical protein